MPVAPGRNIAILVEVAARNQLLRSRGHHAARALADRLERVAARRARRRPTKKTRSSTRGRSGESRQGAQSRRSRQGGQGSQRGGAGRNRAEAATPHWRSAKAGPPFIILTGLSGSGKSQAIRALEDLGYFCVDNLPTTLIPTLAKLSLRGGGDIEKVAIVVDVREGNFLSSFPKIFRRLRKMPQLNSVLIFLEASTAGARPSFQ